MLLRLLRTYFLTQTVVIVHGFISTLKNNVNAHQEFRTAASSFL